MTTIDRAWRNYVEVTPATDAPIEHREVRIAFYAGAMSTLLAINESLDPADYAARPRLAERMRALTHELNHFSHELEEGRV